MASISFTANPKALLVSVTALFTKPSSFSSLAAMASDTPLVTSLISIPASPSAFVTYCIIAPSFFSFITIPTTRFSLLIASTTAAACAAPSSPFGLTCTARSNPHSSLSISRAFSISAAFFPPATTCIPRSVNINSVSGSSYENSHTSSATAFRYRKSSSLFAPVPTTSALAPPNAPSRSARHVSYRHRIRAAHDASSIVGAPIARDRLARRLAGRARRAASLARVSTRASTRAARFAARTRAARRDAAARRTVPRSERARRCRDARARREI